jgi:enterochelin esterase family protein
VNPLLVQLLEQKRLSFDGVTRFAQSHDIPLVDGDRVTFLFWGEAERVNLQHWIFGLPSSLAFSRVEGRRLWYRDVELPRNSRVEYKLEVVRDGRSEWILDPLNPRQAHDPFGANSVCHGPGYVTPAWTRPDPVARQGTLDVISIESHALESRREIPVYLPARFRKSGRYPLLVVHDGNDYVRYASLKTVLDNLIHHDEIPAMVVALSNPGDRLREYADDPRHGRHIAEEIVPTLSMKFPLIKRAAARGLIGASFGAVASLSTAWRHPGVFGRLLVQSGSFAFSDIGHHRRSHEFDPVARFVNAFREKPGRFSEKVYVSCGMYESLIYENRSLMPVLQDTGMDVRYVEARDGHNWENWRDRLREGLSWLFPGPLWMVYE